MSPIVVEGEMNRGDGGEVEGTNRVGAFFDLLFSFLELFSPNTQTEVWVQCVEHIAFQ